MESRDECQATAGEASCETRSRKPWQLEHCFAVKTCLPRRASPGGPSEYTPDRILIPPYLDRIFLTSYYLDGKLPLFGEHAEIAE